MFVRMIVLVATADLLDGDTYKTLKLGIPKGDKGDTGDPLTSLSQEQMTLLIHTIGEMEGLTGAEGSDGQDGNDGITPVISVSAETLPAGSNATAVRTGTDANPHITFGIPAGQDGTGAEENCGVWLDHIATTTLNPL